VALFEIQEVLDCVELQQELEINHPTVAASHALQ
jgi:hypothetical protein